MAADFDAVTDGFLRLDSAVLERLGIIAVIAGGSTIYEHAFNGKIEQARDLDSAIIVKDVRALAHIINEERHDLKRIMRLEREECPEFPAPASKDSAWALIDAVRYAGFSADGQKRSVKLITAEHFLGTRRCMNVLSYKDKRVYEGLTMTGGDALRLQPASRLPSGVTILHDPWVFCSRQTQAPFDIAFGVTADLLITGAWLVGDETGRSIRNALLDYALSRAGNMPLGFARHRRFTQPYIHWLESQLGRPLRRDNIVRSSNATAVLLGDATQAARPNLIQWPGEISRLSNGRVFAKTTTGQLDHELVGVLQSPFTNNARNTIIKAKVHSRSQQHSVITMFSKEGMTGEQLSECQGALQAARYFPLVQQPLAECGRLLYPIFNGITEAEAQLKYACTSDEIWMLLVLDVEMHKAEDMYNAYKWSLRPSQDTESPTSDWEIHRFFHQRLKRMSRLRTFYGSGVDFGQGVVELETLMNTPLEINGKEYSSLASMHATAEAILQPDRFLGMPVAFGLGDAHGGNIMIEEQAQPTDARRLMYIDYEVSSHHSPILDLAKPFYNDVFFRALYTDCIPTPPRVAARFEDGKLKLKLRNTASTIGYAILQIKRQYLIEPLAALAPELNLEQVLVPRYWPVRCSHARCSRGISRAIHRRSWWLCAMLSYSRKPRLWKTYGL